MNDYISREAAAKVLCDACGNAACPKGLIPRCSYYERMQKIPAADVRPVVHGKWAVEEVPNVYVGSAYRLTCSECEDSFVISKTALPYEHFCRNCGAKMKWGWKND